MRALQTAGTLTAMAHAAHVAVDRGTGHVELIDYVDVEDVGRAVGPTMLRGQIGGAVVQGLGGTLLEQLAYDEEGQLLSDRQRLSADPYVCDGGASLNIQARELPLLPARIWQLIEASRLLRKPPSA